MLLNAFTFDVLLFLFCEQSEWRSLIGSVQIILFWHFTADTIVESAVSLADAVAKCANLCTLPDRPTAVGERVVSDWVDPGTEYSKLKVGVVTGLKANAIAIEYDDGTTAEVSRVL